jgi:hypothetical protein
MSYATVNTVQPTTPRTYGIVADFGSPTKLLEAAAKMRAAGYRNYDAHSPFPIHGMDDATGEKRSRVSYFAAATAIAGGAGLLLLIWWVTTQASPLIISGKPLFSYQAFFPPIFAICVLSAAIGSLLAFMSVMGMKFHHPLFNSELFAKFSDDGFLISVEASDPNFNSEKTAELLKSLGATVVEVVEGV